MFWHPIGKDAASRADFVAPQIPWQTPHFRHVRCRFRDSPGAESEMRKRKRKRKREREMEKPGTKSKRKKEKQDRDGEREKERARKMKEKNKTRQKTEKQQKSTRTREREREKHKLYTIIVCLNPHPPVSAGFTGISLLLTWQHTPVGSPVRGPGCLTAHTKDLTALLHREQPHGRLLARTRGPLARAKFS